MAANSADSAITSAATKLIPDSVSPAEGTHIAITHAALATPPVTVPIVRPRMLSIFDTTLLFADIRFVVVARD